MSVPAARLFQCASGGCPSTHDAITSQAPRMIFTQLSGRVSSQIAMVAMLVTIGADDPVVGARGIGILEHGRRRHQPDAGQSGEKVRAPV
jgi:hypothetical protein